MIKINGVQCCFGPYWLSLYGHKQLQNVNQLQIISFVFCRRKKAKHIWSNMRLNKWRQNCHFGVNHPFKSHADFPQQKVVTGISSDRLWWDHVRWMSIPGVNQVFVFVFEIIASCFCRCHTGCFMQRSGVKHRFTSPCIFEHRAAR